MWFAASNMVPSYPGIKKLWLISWVVFLICLLWGKPAAMSWATLWGKRWPLAFSPRRTAGFSPIAHKELNLIENHMSDLEAGPSSFKSSDETTIQTYPLTTASWETLCLKTQLNGSRIPHPKKCRDNKCSLL